MKRCVFASNNAGKLAELNALTASLGWKFETQASLGVSEAAEPFGTFLENSLAKARHASLATGLPALADDSGLCLRALEDAPGVRSARWAEVCGRQALIDTLGRDRANNTVLREAMMGHNRRQAKFVSVLVFLRYANDPVPMVAEGEWQGLWVDAPSGEHGFGYDPHFFVPSLGQTAAQLSAEVKNQYSHRAQAMKKMLGALSAF